MKKSKKLLSVLLAVLIAMSSLTVGFAAFAADAKDKSTAVQDAEAAVDAFSSHKYNLYSANADKKKAARVALDKAADATKKLSDKERAEMDKAKFTSLASYVAQLVANEEKSPSNQLKAEVLQNEEKLAQLEEKIGTLPQALKEAIDAMAPYNVKSSNGKYLYDKVFAAYDKAQGTFTQDEELVAALTQLEENFKKLSTDAVEYAGSLKTFKGGFYINNSLDATLMFKELSGLVVEKYIDMVSPTGKKPDTKIEFKDYVSRIGSYGSYKYEWKDGMSAQKYIDDFNAFVKDNTIPQFLEPNTKAVEELCNVIDSKAEYKGAGSLYFEAVKIGAEIFTTGKTDLEAANKLIDKINNASDTAKAGIAVLNSSKCYPAYEIQNLYTDASTLTPEQVYTKYTRVVEKSSSNCYSEVLGYPSRVLVPEFEKLVNSMSVEKTTYEELAEAKAMFVKIGGYQDIINADVMTKFKELVMNIKNPYDYSKEIKEFKQTEFVRPETESNIAWTTGGIQSAVDGLWKTVKDLGPVLGIDLSNGLNSVLSQNLYKADMIEMILDLYVTIESDPSLGGYIGLLGISVGNLKKFLVEEKFAGAVEKMESAKSFADVAAIEFEAKDFGFTDGDKDGFVNAALAVLRPITAILGTSKFGISWFAKDEIGSATAERTPGIYGALLPALEQLGLNLPDVDALHDNYVNVKEANTEKYGKGAEYIAYDETLRPLINALFKDIVDPIVADPLNGLIAVLPRLAYVLDGKVLDSALRDVLNPDNLGSIVGGIVGGLEVPTIDGEFINGLLKAPIDLSSLVGMEAGKVTIQLEPIDWKALANCATVERIDSVTIKNMYALLRTGETDSCFSTLFYYIYDVLFANDANYASLLTLLNNVGIPSFIMGTVIGALDGLKSAGKVNAYGQVLDMFGVPTGDVIEKPDPDQPTDPDKPTDPNQPTDPEIPNGNDGDKVPVIPGSDDEDANSPTIPDTGATENVVTAFAVLTAVAVVLATAIFFVMRKKGLID